MTTAVLLMAYGSPRSLDEVAPYLRDIRGGKPIRPGLLEDLTERYRMIGGSSPLLEMTRAQAAAVASALGPGFHVAVGMKHWHPYIAEAIETLPADVDRLIGVALAPHYSSISIGGYEARVREVLITARPGLAFSMVDSWYGEPAFIELVARNVRDALDGWDPGTTRVFFTAHSLPERIVAAGDPYLDQLLGSAKLVADAAGVPDHAFAFQSSSVTGEPWLGPDILEALTAYAEQGGTRAVICPVGFVADHLEILYDIDIEAAAHAEKVGLALRRTRSPNADPLLADAIEQVVRSVSP
ncbi:MAG: ferrochelatase [Actinomycetota bacterium]